MSTTYDRARCAELVSEMRADDELMTPADQWNTDIGVYQDPIDDDDCAFARGPMVHRGRGEAYEGRWRKQAQIDSTGTCRIRNRLRETADQLEGAGKRIAELESEQRRIDKLFVVRSGLLVTANERIAELEAELATLRAAKAASGLTAEDIKLIDRALGTLSSDYNDAPHDDIERIRRILGNGQ